MASDENPPCVLRGWEKYKIDDALRDRVDHAMEELKRSLDAAISNPTTRNLNQLRDATDRVLRASARILIELGRSDDYRP